MQTPDKDRLDLWLDEALRQQGNIEPRDGLECRLLAKLRPQQEHAWSVGRWAWVFAVPVVAAVTITLALWIGKGSPIVGRDLVQKSFSVKSENDINGHAMPPIAKNEKTPSLLSNPQARRGSNGEPGRERHRAMRLTEKPQAEVVRRRRQFPSEHPLTEQEQLLAEYVTQFPDQAKLVAQEQAKTEKEMDELYSENISRGSEQER